MNSTIIVAQRRIGYKTVKRHKVDIQYNTPVDSPERARALFKLLLEDEPEEALYCLALDSSNRWLGCISLGVGTIDRCVVYPRKLMTFLLVETNASGVILCHNHPGGIKKASHEDKTLTRRLKELLKSIDVRLLDHMIYCDSNAGDYAQGWLSFREEGLLQ